MGCWSRLEAAIVQTSLPIVRDVLERHKASTGEFDFDDQIQGVAHALDGVHGDELVRAMRARYRFALIDEFQDTDELQWSFFQRVFVESEGRNLRLPDRRSQAIDLRLSRGRRSHVPSRLAIEWSKRERRLCRSCDNFRSTRELIDAYNHILDSSAAVPFFDGRFATIDRSRRAVSWSPFEADGKPATPVHLLKIEQRGR